MSAGLAAPPGERIRNGRILVVDDSVFFRGLLVDMLQADGHEVLSAGGTQAALDLLDAGEAPDLVLLDLDLPGLDGRKLLAEIRTRHASADLPVLVLTEIVASTQDLDRLAELGADGVLNKLAPPDHVRFRVRSALFPAAREERRRSRVALSLSVRYRVVGDPCLGRTHSLSPDGAFIRSSEPPPVGTLVELQVELGDPPRLVPVAGEVVRAETDDDGGRAPRGFAVRFTKITPADRQALAELLARVQDKGL